MANAVEHRLLLAQGRAQANAQQLDQELQAPEPEADQVRCILSCLTKDLEVLSLRQDEVIGTTDPSDISSKIQEMLQISTNIQSIANKANKWLNRRDIEARISTSVHSDQGSRGRVKLPDLKLPSFSGDPLKWCEFWDIMRSNIFDVVNLSEVEKFTYLRTALKGPFPWVTLFFIDFELGPALYSPWGRLTGAKKFWLKKNSKCLAQGITFFR